MKIKKSDVAMAVQWIEVQIAREDSFPFDQTNEKAAKKNLKALKDWRKCTSSVQDIREWADEWLTADNKKRFQEAIVAARSYKADCPINLTKDALKCLEQAAEAAELSPSELIIAHFSLPALDSGSTESGE